MRPDIKRMNERLGYFLHEMDLANAHVDHAEREIERLEKELHDTKGENGLLFARNIELERAREFPCDARISELNAEIDRLKNNLNEFVKANNNLNEKNCCLDDEIIDYHREIEQLKEENYWLKQSVETENDRLERNDELTKENARLMKAVNQLKEDVNIKNINIEKLESQIGALGVTIKWKQDQIDALKKPLEEAHYCNCGATAYIYHMLNDGKYYCGHCFKKEVIKL